MPDERDPQFDTEFDNEKPDDDDVPFHLPMNDDEMPEEKPLDVKPDKAHIWDAANPADARNMPTMPIPREPGVPDPKLTLPGSGGLDPNPDFVVSENTQPTSTEHTAQHKAVQIGHTVPHMPAVPQQQSGYVPPEHQQFTRPQQAQPGYMPPPPPGQAQQSVPQGNALPRRKAKARGCLGCSPTCLGIIVGFIAIFCGGLTLLTLIVSATLGARIEDQLQEQVAQVDTYQQFQSTFYYDRGGRLLYEVFNEGRRTTVAFEEFPQILIDATVAIEDDNFFTNPGIDVPATLRAFAQYVGLAEGSTGGSTITQQIVRNVLFDYEYRSERSIQRKVEEILLALVLTQRKTKNEILELYLNEIYYGNMSYGAEAAAQTFFGKHVSDLTLGEAALLAGLPQTPAELDPLNPDPVIQQAVYERWTLVLERMVTTGKITDAQRNEALRQGYTLVTPDVSLEAPHFTVYVQREMERVMGELGYSPEEVVRGGWRVYTTLDLSVNEMAEQAARDQVSRLSGNNVTNAAVLAMVPVTGEIIAMVGSVDYNNEAIDGKVNVTISVRQPGSTMKPFTYSAAMENGMTPGDVIWDTPVRIGIPGQPMYEPRNYDGAFHGPVIMRTALANSYNIPAVQTLRRYGVDYLLQFMQRFGVESLGTDGSIYGLSLTLGGGEISLLELTNAYSVFSNQGSYVRATGIMCILDNDDNIVYQYENRCPRGNVTERTVNRTALGRQALDPRVAFVVSDMLSDNPARSPAMGSNSPLNTGSLDAAVKTGTTNDVKDNWTVGYTRNVAVGVWVGNSNGDPMVNSSGLTGAAPIWNAVITSIYAGGGLNSFTASGQIPDQFTPPSGVSLREICDVRALRDPATDCSRVNEWFLDSPAALPDAEGNLQYPPAQPEQQPQQQPGQPQLTIVSPGVYQVLAFRLAPEIANLIQFPVQPGQPNPPAPLYCQVPPELAGAATGSQPLLFIAPPPVPEDAVAAEQYARNNGLAFLPTIACSPDLLQGGGGGFGPIVTTAVITSPQPGQVLSGETPIIGTVQFTADQGKFYKLEVRGGPFGDWVTIGTTHTENVVNGQLENLYVPGLAPGNYVLRLVIVDSGGGFLQTPYEVPFSVQ